MPPHPGNNEIWTTEQLSSFKFGKVEDIRHIEREIEEMQWALRGRSQYDGEPLHDGTMAGGEAPNPEYLQECIAANKATLTEMRPPEDLTPVQINKYVRLKEELEERFSHFLMTREQLEDDSDNHVEMNMCWQELPAGAGGARDVIAWQNVLRVLDPTNDSPFFTSIERLRPATPPRNDPRTLRMNWDKLRFTDQQQRQQEHIADQLFMQFVYYRGLEYSTRGIKKLLGLSDLQWEACLDRQEREKALAHAEEAGEAPEVEEDMRVGLMGAQPLSVDERGPWAKQELARRNLKHVNVARDLSVDPGQFSRMLNRQGRRMNDQTYHAMLLWLRRYDLHPENFTAYVNPVTVSD